MGPLFLIGQIFLSCSLGGNWKRHAGSSPWGFNWNQISEVKLKLVIFFSSSQKQEVNGSGSKDIFSSSSKITNCISGVHCSIYFMGTAM